ncbi:MAG: hypothetical protein V4732_05040 [Pseudomonadota bacterium]
MNDLLAFPIRDAVRSELSWTQNNQLAKIKKTAVLTKTTALCEIFTLFTERRRAQAGVRARTRSSCCSVAAQGVW